MKDVLFVIESLNCGGSEKSLLAILQNFDYSKYNVDLLMIVEDSEFQKFLPKEVNVIFFKPLKDTGFFKLLLNRIQLKVLKIDKKFHPAQVFWRVFGKSIPNHNKFYDTIFASNQGFATYFVATKTKSFKKIAYLNIDYKIAGYKPSFDIGFYKKFDKIISVSGQCESIFINEMNLIGQKFDTQVIYDITDVTSVLSLSKVGKKLPDSNKIKIVTVCRLTHQKGLDLAIEACDILVRKGYDINWFIVGEGVLRPKLEALITKFKLQNNFYLLGFDENPFGYMKSCDIYVQTSIFEGLGLTVLEAKIIEKPIVCTNFPTVKHILKDDFSGLICEMNSIDIASKIEKYINNPDLKNKIINNLKKPDNSEKERTMKSLYQLIES